MGNKLTLTKIVVPEDPENHYFVTFISSESETEEVSERHGIDIEVLVQGKIPLGKVKEVAEEKAKRFLKELANKL